LCCCVSITAFLRRLPPFSFGTDVFIECSPSFALSSFFFLSSCYHPDLHSFPTRRSSDLPAPLIVIDMGTATTMSVIDPAGNYIGDRKSTRLNSSHVSISYAVFCLKKKIHNIQPIK